MAKLKTKKKKVPFIGVRQIDDRKVLIDNESLHFMADVITEVGAATAKFPQPNPTFAALVEEVGEVAKALMDLQLGKATHADVYNECRQVAAMATRIAIEGDPAFLKSVR